jgi:hypothetical protein
MRKIIAFVFLLLVAAGPALAQQDDRKDKIQREDEDQLGAAADATIIMDRVLPFVDGQTLRYFAPDGRLEGSAHRRGLSIRFYDEQGNYIGRAKRVSQAATVYYAANGTYLGRRLHRKLTLKTRTVDQPKDNGFKPVNTPEGN